MVLSGGLHLSAGPALSLEPSSLDLGAVKACEGQQRQADLGGEPGRVSPSSPYLRNKTFNIILGTPTSLKACILEFRVMGLPEE